MAIRDNQKMVVFSEKELVKVLTEEEAKNEGINTSNVIEKNLLENMLTSNENINYWLRALYKDEVSMNRFMQALWGIVADDWTHKMRKKSNFELVQIAKKMANGERAAIYNKEFNGKYSPSYLVNQLDSIAKACENVVVTSRETDTFVMEILRSDDITKNITTASILRTVKKAYSEPIKKTVDYINYVIDLINSNIDNINLDQIYEIVIETWEYIYQYPFTYKLLMELAKLQKNYNLDMRYTVRKAIIKASGEWY